MVNDLNKNRTDRSTNLCNFSGKRCILGIDEAGRGPVLGPMVYGIGVCLSEKTDQLKELGVADSKILTDVKRSEIFNKMNSDTDCLDYFAYALEVLSPHYISTSMTQRVKYNLNEISHDTAIRLIRLCVEVGIIVDKIFVDTVGPSESYQRKLEEKFPRIEICVSKKADSLFPIVSAASICAKVTRDNVLAGWICKDYLSSEPEGSDELSFGSGYPADPNTKLYMDRALHPVFGYPTVVRFSWATTQDILDSKAIKVEWEDDGASNGKPPPKSRSLLSFFSKNGAIQEAPPRHAFFEERKLKHVILL